MKEIEAFIEAGMISKSANSDVLSKEELELNDVKKFLFSQLQLDEVLRQAYSDKEKLKNIDVKIRRIRKDLGNWDSDRSDAFFDLLSITQQGYISGQSETLEAGIRCCITLLQEPLIEPVDETKFSRIIGISNRALEESIKSDSDSMVILNAYAEGILYNAVRFCPGLFKEDPSEEFVLDQRNKFLSSLGLMQDFDAAGIQ